MAPQFCRVRMALSALRLVPHIAVLLASPRYKILQADLAHWAAILRPMPPVTTKQYVAAFIYFMTFNREFRNLFYLRAGRWSRLLGILCPKLGSLDIAASHIGPALFIQHGEGTYVSARRIGANCWIGRQVVVGYSAENHFPTIGDNVRIYAGAKIVGNITIGDGATIGLNTVITDNVPAGATMLGVPGRVIWRSRPQEPAVPAVPKAFAPHSPGMDRRTQTAPELLRCAPEAAIGDKL